MLEEMKIIVINIIVRQKSLGKKHVLGDGF